MKRRTLIFSAALAGGISGIAYAASKAETQAEVHKAADQALAAVYKVQPSARKAVESAAGYASPEPAPSLIRRRV